VKALFRAPAVQVALALILTGYLKLCFATLRWRSEGEAAAEAARRAKGGVIVCFWHSRIALSPPIWPLHDPSTPEPRALISLSPDGEFIARAMAWLGFPAIRGSSIKASARDKRKGGASAFREALAWIKGGGGLAITPDGPRGPAETMAEGAVRLAQRTGAPVLLAGLACAPAIRLKSWDRAMLPVPFARAAAVYAGPLQAPGELEPEALAGLCDQWGRGLSDVTRRAEALVA
jgi:lysophospholipid acyltransferase (LPLAT)-like uncharacterized protein